MQDITKSCGKIPEKVMGNCASQVKEEEEGKDEGKEEGKEDEKLKEEEEEEEEEEELIVFCRSWRL